MKTLKASLIYIQIEFKTDGTKNMKNKKDFTGRFVRPCHVIGMGLVSCGLKAKTATVEKRYNRSNQFRDR